MNIVVLDGYTLNPGDLTWEGLEKFGRVTVYDRTAFDASGEERIIERIGDAEAVFTNKTPVTAKVMEASPKLRYVGVLATGYNVVDTAAAKRKGITVTNIPTYGTDAVAQMAIALLLEICHHVGAHDASVKNGEWAGSADWCYWKHPLIELAGKTMGIIGYGRIGQTTGRIAQALGMSVLAFDSVRNKALESPSMRYAGLDELLARSDVITLHCPLFESTRGIINKDTLARMKKSVILINNARGPLIVEQDLADALNGGKIFAAAVDVLSTEPVRPDNPLLHAKNCIITPHISWAPVEARRRLMDIAVSNFGSFLAGEPVNVVNA